MFYFSKHLSRILTLLTIASSLACGGSKTAPPLRVFAAASLITPLSQLAEEFKQETPRAAVQLTFAASSMLAKQIEHGAAADIYFSANLLWMDYLQDKGLIKKGSRVNVLGNSLVVVAPLGSNLPILSTADLLDVPFDRLALGDWRHVPAGIYAKQALESLGLWHALQRKCLAALNVRAALAYVERGQADLGIVYRSDAALSHGVKILFQLPDSSHAAIIYPAALTLGSTHPQAPEFLRYLQSQRSWHILKRDGFQLINSRE